LTSFVPRKRRVELRLKRKEEENPKEWSENPMVGMTLPKGVSFFFSHLYFCNSIIVCYVLTIILRKILMRSLKKLI
jgi:hypothetical protein